MRFALRNKFKLIQAFGEDEYSMILSSLKLYAMERDEPETAFQDGVNYPILSVCSPGETMLLSDQNGMLFTLLSMEKINRGGTVVSKAYECSVSGGSHHRAI